MEEEKRRRDQASNASGESSHLGEAAEVGAPEQRKTKKKNNGEAEGEAATSEVVSVSGKKGERMKVVRRDITESNFHLFI